MFITCNLKTTYELRLDDAILFMRDEEVSNLDSMLQTLGFGQLSRKHLEELKIVVETMANEITDIELSEFSIRFNQVIFAYFMGCYGIKTYQQLLSRNVPQI